MEKEIENMEVHPLDDMGKKLTQIMKEGVEIMESGDLDKIEAHIDKASRTLEEAEELTNHYRKKGDKE